MDEVYEETLVSMRAFVFSAIAGLRVEQTHLSPSQGEIERGSSLSGAALGGEKAAPQGEHLLSPLVDGP